MLFNVQKGNFMKKISLIIALCGVVCLNHTQSVFAKTYSRDSLRKEAEDMVYKSKPMAERNKKFDEYARRAADQDKMTFAMFYAEARLNKWATESDQQDPLTSYKEAIKSLLSVVSRLKLANSPLNEKIACKLIINTAIGTIFQIRNLFLIKDTIGGFTADDLIDIVKKMLDERFKNSFKPYKS